MSDYPTNAQPVKLIGADSTGEETDFVGSTPNGLSIDGLQSKTYNASVALAPSQTIIVDCTNARTLHIFVDSVSLDPLISVDGSIDGVTYPYIMGSALSDTNNEVQFNYPYPTGIYSIPTAGYKKIRITNSHATETINVATTLSSHQSALQGIIGRQYNSLVNGGDIGAAVLFSAPGSDTGQGALAVRVISQLGAGSSGGSDGAINDGANALLKATVTADNALKVDGSAVTQPISGTVDVSNFPATQPISASALPLPTGAATDSSLTNGNQKTQLVDGSGNVFTSNNIGGRRQLEVSVSNTALTVGGTVAVSNSFALDATLTGGTAKNRLLDGSGSAITSTTISAKQALDVNVVNTTSVPVTGPLTDTQLRASAVPVSGTVSANATLSAETTKVIGTINIASSQSVGLSAGSALVGKVGIDQTTPGTTNKVYISNDGQVAATQSGTWNINNLTGTVSLPTGASTETTLAAMSAKLPTALGTKTIANSMAVNIASDQIVNVALNERSSLLYKGRACTFRTPGLAGSAGQKLMSIHNATGSTITVKVTKIFVDLMQTVIKAVTTAPPIVRVWKVTALPASGDVMTKVQIDGSSSSNSSVTVRQGASADGTASGTALAATLPSGTIISQEFAPRMITAAGYEMADRMVLLENTEVKLGALEGIVVFLDYSSAGQNPITDMWVGGIEWSEY